MSEKLKAAKADLKDAKANFRTARATFSALNKDFLANALDGDKAKAARAAYAEVIKTAKTEAKLRGKVEALSSPPLAA